MRPCGHIAWKIFSRPAFARKKLIKSKKSKLSWAKKILLPSSDLTEKNSLPQRQIWIKSSADKNISYISKPKKKLSKRCFTLLWLSRGCSSHFLDIWIRTNPLCQLEKKLNLPETLFFQFFIAFGGVTLYIFLAGDSVIHLVKSRDWLESKIVLYYGICGPFFNNFQISCQWLFFGAE